MRIIFDDPLFYLRKWKNLELNTLYIRVQPVFMTPLIRFLGRKQEYYMLHIHTEILKLQRSISSEIWQNIITGRQLHLDILILLEHIVHDLSEKIHKEYQIIFYHTFLM